MYIYTYVTTYICTFSKTALRQGVSAAALHGSWVAFFCKECAPHLAVRKNAQVSRVVLSVLSLPVLSVWA